MADTDTKTKIKRPRIDSDQFVKIWVEVFNNDGTQQDVADRVGCSLPGLLNKVKRLEEEGVSLPELKKAPRKSGVDVDELNRYISKNVKK